MSGVINVRKEVPSGTLLHDTGFQFPVTAGHVFCSITPPAGSYRIRVNRIAYGTGQPSIANNSRLFVGSTEYTLTTAGALGIWYEYDFYVTVNGSTAIQVRSVADGSANIGVTAGITAYKLS